MTAVLVSHPHNAAFSVGVAQGLQRTGQLAAFATGVAFADAGWSGRVGRRLAAARPVLFNRLVEGIPVTKLRPLAPVELSARAVSELVRGAGGRLKTYDALFVAHDAAVSLMPWPSDTTGIYAYEDGALWTFRRAARRHLARIWDLPLPHYLTIEELWAEETRRWPTAPIGPAHSEPPWKRRRKDAELALATRVSVASVFTRRSLERIGLSVPVTVVPYGFPTREVTERSLRPSGKFTVIAVGTQDLRKGTPYLLEAWKRAAIPDAELHLIGPLRLSKTFLDGYAGLFRHSPHIPKSELRGLYAAADLLAFPTLGDGFGLVIQEAMCSGTPVVTTPCGGGPECITDDVDGWLVPPRDVDALVDRLRACAADRDHAFRLGQAARRRAERWTWEDAGAALARALA